VLQSKGILSDFQKTFLRLFASLSDHERFYLTGGTALAEYYLGHRLSYDLDLFTSEADLIVPFSYRVEQVTQATGMEVAVVRRFASFVEFQVSQGEDRLKVDLALDSHFRFAPTELSDTGVWVNGFQDIQTDKTLAFFGRAEPRDAIDLYFLLQKTSFEELAELAHQKDTGFDLYWFAVALNRVTKFPDEIDRWPVKMLVECDPIELKRTFQSLAMRIMAKQMGKG
jgi:predicted nucleotidyltransferase component of viral defense system